MNVLARLSTAALAATVAFAAPANAQVNYYTQGQFTGGGAGCNQGAPTPGAPSGTTCNTSGFSLMFAPKMLNPGPIASGSIVSLGRFELDPIGTTTVPPSTLTFTLYIRQVAPNSGSGNTGGFISGQVTVGPGGDLSTLVWRPTQFVNIDPVTYQLVFDNVGPGAGTGIGIPIRGERGINALVTVNTNVVPEPGTYALMASGLVALGVVARRRRTS